MMKIGGNHRIAIRLLNRKSAQFKFDPAILQKIFLEAKKNRGKPNNNIKKNLPQGISLHREALSIQNKIIGPIKRIPAYYFMPVYFKNNISRYFTRGQYSSSTNNSNLSTA